MSIISTVFPPPFIDSATAQMNEKTILKMLIDGNCFDINLRHQEKDILELHLSVHDNPNEPVVSPYIDKYLVYAYKFKKGIWKTAQFDPFDANLDDIQKGKIINPFVKPNRGVKTGDHSHLDR